MLIVSLTISRLDECQPLDQREGKKVPQDEQPGNGQTVIFAGALG
jgi:hypothetical protein